jgi:hypothetical protein
MIRSRLIGSAFEDDALTESCALEPKPEEA